MQRGSSSFRSVLLAPGNRPDVCAKLPRSVPAAAVLDLEDGVPPEARVETRAIVRASIEQLAAAHPEIGWFVRVNGVPTEWFADDVRDALPPAVDGIVLPKVDSVAHVAAATTALDAAGLEHVGIVLGVETARGVDAVREVAAHPRVVAMYFGAEDFVADMGGVRTAASTEVLYARSRIALAARVAGIAAIDQVVVAYRDDDAFLEDARVGRSIGYAGKLCIHPSQVALANQVFSPSAQEVAQARALVAAYDDAVRAGRGAISVDGRMVDEALVRNARAIVAAADDEGATD